MSSLPVLQESDDSPVALSGSKRKRAEQPSPRHGDEIEVALAQPATKRLRPAAPTPVREARELECSESLLSPGLVLPQAPEQAQTQAQAQARATQPQATQPQPQAHAHAQAHAPPQASDVKTSPSDPATATAPPAPAAALQRAPLWPLDRLLQSEVDDDMLEWMMLRERDYQPDIAYMNRQSQVDPGMRSILFSWMGEVSHEFMLGRETWHMATNYVDRFLSVNPDPRTHREMQRASVPAAGAHSPQTPASHASHTSGAGTPSSASTPPTGASPSGRSAGPPYVGDLFNDTVVITRTNLQLLGVTCLFIASKAEEIYPPTARDFAVTTDGAYSPAQIDAMERRILHSLQWNLMPQTAFAWVKIFIQMMAKCVHDEIASSGLSSPLPSSHKHAGAGLPRRKTPYTMSTLETLIDMPILLRCMELIDVAMLDIWALRFYPSALAASALLLLLVYEPAYGPVVDVAILKHVTGYEPADLVTCVALLKEISDKLPYRGLQKVKPYFENLRIPAEDLYTRQSHHPDALRILSDLGRCGYNHALHCTTQHDLLRVYYPHLLLASPHSAHLQWLGLAGTPSSASSASSLASLSPPASPLPAAASAPAFAVGVDAAEEQQEQQDARKRRGRKGKAVRA